jgi:Ni/Co efflux regulator RcnB
MQNPQTQQNPQAMGALQAHIQQHQALKYRIQVEEMLAQQGVQLPQPGPDGQLPQLPPEAESQIAMAAAQATQQITGQEQALAQAMAAQQQDPQRQMFEEQMELEFEKLKQRDRESERKAQLERERIESQEQQTDIRVASELQQAEMRDDREVDSNLTEIAKIVRESQEKD